MSLVVEIEKTLGDFHLDVSFTHTAGTLALLGSSGAGKSVTMACIAGLITPDRGKIILDGVPLFDAEAGINLPPQQRGIGLLFQGYALFPNMTVWQNVACGLHREKDKAVKREKVAQMLTKMQLTEKANQYPAQLSGGQQQRVAIARTLIANPKLLIFDEPFSALDTALRREIEQVVTEVLAEFTGKTLLITHNTEEAYRLSQNLLVMLAGQTLCFGETEAVFAAPQKKAAAQLMGCENILPCVRISEHELFLPSLQQQITVQRSIPNSCSYIGFYASDLLPCEGAPSQEAALQVADVQDMAAEMQAGAAQADTLVIQGQVVATRATRTEWLVDFKMQQNPQGAPAQPSKPSASSVLNASQVLSIASAASTAESLSDAQRYLCVRLPKKDYPSAVVSSVDTVCLSHSDLLFLAGE